MYVNVYIIALLCVILPYGCLSAIMNGMIQLIFYIIWAVLSLLIQCVIIENVPRKYEIEYNYDYKDALNALITVFSIIGLIHAIIVLTKFEMGIFGG